MSTPAPLPVVMDVDTGIDDAMALLYAHFSPVLKLLAVTTCFGNGDVSVTTRNTLAVLDLVESRVPVYRGAAAPLADSWAPSAEAFHGSNGLGGAVIPEPRRAPEDLPAARFLVEAADRHPGEITVVAVARLTNLALAEGLDPDFPKKLRGLIVMGGASFVAGNVTPAAEANIWGDAPAAHKVFHSGASLTMVGLDVTHQALFTDGDLERLDPSRPYSRLVRQAGLFYLNAYNPGSEPGSRTAPLHDPLAVALAEEPDLAGYRDLPVDIERDGTLTRGATIVDTRPYSQTPANCRVALTLDGERFRRRFRERLGIGG